MSYNKRNSQYNYTNDDHVISSPNNGSQIVLGKDRKLSPFSGYGVVPNKVDVNSIELVVGRGSQVGEDDRAGDILVNTLHTDDAAKIYISEKSDPDDYFKFRVGKTGKSIAQSSIVLHADTIRIGAREKIKLITATSPDGKLSNNSIAEMHGIELIAGGGKATQSMVLGDNLVAYLTDLNSCMTELNGHVTNLTNTVNGLITDYATHVHPVASIGAPSGPSPTAAAKGFSSAAEIMLLLLDLSSTDRAMKELEKDKILNPFSEEYILSKYNRCN